MDQADGLTSRRCSWDGWKVVCLKVFLERYLVVGGTGGSLVIIDLLNEDEVVLTCKLPGAMINSLALRRRDQDTRLLVCENSLRSTFQGHPSLSFSLGVMTRQPTLSSAPPEYTFPEMTTVTVSSVPDSQCYTLINGLAFSPNDRWLVRRPAMDSSNIQTSRRKVDVGHRCRCWWGMHRWSSSTMRARWASTSWSRRSIRSAATTKSLGI